MLAFNIHSCFMFLLISQKIVAMVESWVTAGGCVRHGVQRRGWKHARGRGGLVEPAPFEIEVARAAGVK